MSTRKRYTFSVNCPDKETKDKLSDTLKQLKERDYTDTATYTTLLKILEEKLLSPINEIHYQSGDTRELAEICELNFLKRIVDKKTGDRLYHCLKQQRPNGKGKPIILADGRDIESIKDICQACHDGYLYNKQSKVGADAIKAIIRFGDKDISIKMCSCIHPENDMVFFSLGGTGSFPCKKTDTRVSIEKTCENTLCNYLHTDTVIIKIKDTPAFKEMQEQLEHKGGENN